MSTSTNAASNELVITDADCSMFKNAVELVGGKWNGAILLAVGRGASRFGEIRGQVDGISARLLAARLRVLEQHELVARDVVASHPVQIRYTLTERGIDLVRVLIPLVPWGTRWGITAD
jgi:DNA-binding HxlR family transcriptional regulator